MDIRIRPLSRRYETSEVIALTQPARNWLQSFASAAITEKNPVVTVVNDAVPEYTNAARAAGLEVEVE